MSKRTKKLKKWSKRRFNRWAKSYDISLLQILIFNPTINIILTLIKPFLKRKDMQILDIACGTGKFLKKLQKTSKKRIKLFGIDSSEIMIKQAKKKSRTIKFKIGNAENLPYRNDKFDIITCSHAFHHFQDKKLALLEMCRVLKQDGILIIADGYKRGLWGKIMFTIVEILERNVKHMSKNEMFNLFFEAGFYKTIQVEMNKIAPTLIILGRKYVCK